MDELHKRTIARSTLGCSFDLLADCKQRNHELAAVYKADCGHML